MVFIHETHVTPSRGKVKTKRHLFSYLLHAGSECCPNVSVAPNRKKVPHYVHLAGTVAPSSFIILIDGVYL